MDGDHTAKTFEQGANSAMKDQEMTGGVHESVNQIVSHRLPYVVPLPFAIANNHLALSR